MLQRQHGPNGVKGGLLNPPRPQGYPRPVGPPGQEKGHFNSPNTHHGLGYGPRGHSNYNGPGYVGGDRQRPPYQGLGHYSSNQHQPHQVVPRAPPVHGGSGFMGRGASPQSEVYQAHQNAQAPGPPNVWAPGRGVTVVQQTYVARTHVVTQNGFGPADTRGPQGRGRGRGYQNRQ